MTNFNPERLGIEEDDPGGMLFYGGIEAGLKEIKMEETPQSRGSSCEESLKNILKSCGTMTVLVSLAILLADKAECPHFEWLSSNFNRLANRALEHNTEAYKYPFGE